MRIGLLGVGRWGENHLRTLLGIDGIEVVVYDNDESKISEINERYNVHLVNSFDDVLDCDGVIIATPAFLHFKHAKECLLAGCSVLAEKPITLKSNEARELVELAEKKGLILGVGHLLLYHPAVMKMKELMADYGDILYLMTKRINLGVVREVENVLYSFGSHDISILLYLMERMPDSISCVGNTLIQKDIEDIIFLHLDFGGTPSHSHITWLSAEKRQEIVIYAERGIIWHSDTDIDKLRIMKPKKGKFEDYEWMKRCRLSDLDIIPVNIENISPLRAQLEAFIDAIATKKPIINDGREGLSVLLVLESAMESMRRYGEWVKVKGV
ncbi:MAG: Gfo/Idh/MocA family protein [bacterium]